MFWESEEAMRVSEEAAARALTATAAKELARAAEAVLRAGEAEGIDIGGLGLDELRALWPGNPGSDPIFWREGSRSG